MDGDGRAGVVWASIDALAARHAVAPSVQYACLACVSAVSASGGGVSMARAGGAGEPLFATDPTSRAMQELQFTLGEGPCVDAIEGRRAVLVSELTSPGSGRRWPVFSPAAVELGVRATFSFPIQSGAIRFGVLDLYRPAAARSAPPRRSRPCSTPRRP